MAAVRIILAQGVDALERHGSLDAGAASRTRADLAAGRDREAQARLADAVKRAQQGRGEVPADLARHFGGEAIDAPAANAQCFLLALDFCEASLAGYRRPEVGGIRAEYLDALRRIDAARQRQVEALARLGWKCVRVPSMPDLPLSLNYLNGIHHREGYLLPVIKGFHTPLDQAAMAVFRRALGPQARLAAIHTAACQRNHGGVHCVAAIYP